MGTAGRAARIAAGYGSRMVVDGVTLSIAPGSRLGILGRNGAGKSTLIRCVNLLERPTSGKVQVDGQEMTQLSRRDLNQARHRIGMIFQHFNLLSAKTVWENVALPLRVKGRMEHTYRAEVVELLRWVGLGERMHVLPPVLSGGEKQRIAIGRAIINQPDVIVADEPTGNLDPVNTYEIVEILKKINSMGTTIIITTHNKGVVDAIGKRVITMDAGKIARDDAGGKYVL